MEILPKNDDPSLKDLVSAPSLIQKYKKEHS